MNVASTNAANGTATIKSVRHSMNSTRVTAAVISESRPHPPDLTLVNDCLLTGTAAHATKKQEIALAILYPTHS